jgi:hypothetical protein
MYLKVISQSELEATPIQQLPEIISGCFPWLKPPLVVVLQRLLQLLQLTDVPDEPSIAACLTPLMRFGAIMDGSSWLLLRENLQLAYEATYRMPVSNSRADLTPQEVDISGLSALFAFFNIHNM